MVGFFHLKSASLVEQKKTGEAIMRVSRTVSQNTPESERKKFKDDPRAWLHKAGYRYDGPDAWPDGEIPA